jgi:aspartate 1-decarboxylase
MQVLNCTFVSAQSGNSGKLPWVEGIFPPKSNAFDYRVARGEGHSLKEAREDAFNALLIDLGNKAGVSVNSETLTEIKRDLNFSDATISYDEKETSTTTNRIEREGFTASFLKVGEYYEYTQDVYHIWELYEVSTGKSFTPYIPEYTAHYGVRAAWRSALLPGWGQMHKGSMTKAICIIGGEVALIGGIVAAENLRVSYMQKIKQTHNASHIKTYAGRADTMSNIRNLCITGAAALYIYNLVDAIVAPGNKYLVNRDNRLSLVPAADGTYAGIGLSLNF